MEWPVLVMSASVDSIQRTTDGGWIARSVGKDALEISTNKGITMIATKKERLIMKLKSTTAKITGWGMAAVTVGLTVWDIVVASNDTDGDTISEIILGFAGDWPILAVAFGVLAGHLFWPQAKK